MEDFYVDLEVLFIWWMFGDVNGMMGDLVLYMINVVFVLIGFIDWLIVDVEWVYVIWLGGEVINDDQG